MAADDDSEKSLAKIEFHIEETRETAEIAERLGAEIAALYGPRQERPLSLLAKSEGPIVGGLNGVTHWRWLYVRHLFVAPDWRGRGLGRALLARAEAAARERGCVGAYLDSFSEEAARFYERAGFSRCGRIADFAGSAARIFLQKRF